MTQLEMNEFSAVADRLDRLATDAVVALADARAVLKAAVIRAANAEQRLVELEKQLAAIQSPAKLDSESANVTGA